MQVYAAEMKRRVTTKAMETDNSIQHHLPQGLIGPRCAASVLLEGIPCESILDSGSQVTTISESFHRNHLSHLPIQLIHALLEIEGAGGQHVPYLGYIETHVTFPQTVTGQEEELAALALVVPECHFNIQTPLLIGTNLLFTIYERDRHVPEFMHKLLSKDLALIFQHIARTHVTDNYACPVRLHGRDSINIPARQRCCVMGNVRVSKNKYNTFVLEPHDQHRLPAGVFLESALINIHFKASSKVPVVLHNLSHHSVTLQPKSIIAQVCAAQHVTPLESTQCTSDDQLNSDDLQIDLDDSPIPKEWKERILSKLKSMLEVFAVRDSSHGHTTVVKHIIRLYDETPFKERPRPIHPRDREAVKQHLTELLNAGIIRESESSFASCNQVKEMR